MWLTRSFRPFSFVHDDGTQLPDFDAPELPGLYVHIPFCRSLCGFCPYCKVKFDPELCDTYIDALLEEISLAGRSLPRRKKVTSCYFGGGTPALALRRLPEIIGTLEKYFDITDGIGIELHPDDVNVETLAGLKQCGITRISIGIQSFQDKFQSLLGRAPVKPEALKSALSAVKFETVSMDFIFALPGQTADDLMQDWASAVECGANHVAIYPFIDFTFADGKKFSPVKNRDKRRLLNEITTGLLAHDWTRSSIWTFAEKRHCRYSSMTRDTFIGFGCSAVTLLKDQFRINTFSVEAYCRRLKEGKNAASLRLDFSRRQRMIYFLFWRSYSTELDAADFKKFFGVSLWRMYGFEIFIARLCGLITRKGGILKMTLAGAFYYHYYENFYTLAYIDKMWGIMRKIPFPESLKL